MHLLQVISYIIQFIYFILLWYYKVIQATVDWTHQFSHAQFTQLSWHLANFKWISYSPDSGLLQCLLHIYTYICQSYLTPQGLSTMSRVSITEDQPTLGHSHSVMNIPRTPSSAQIKKRRAPALPGAPPVTVGHVNFDGDQVRMHMHGYMFSFI